MDLSQILLKYILLVRKISLISRKFDLRIISKFLNSRAVFRAFGNSLLARTLFLTGDEFAYISEKN